jgi:hypothetical protein
MSFKSALGRLPFAAVPVLEPPGRGDQLPSDLLERECAAELAGEFPCNTRVDALAFINRFIFSLLDSGSGAGAKIGRLDAQSSLPINVSMGGESPRITRVDALAFFNIFIFSARDRGSVAGARL